MTNQEFDRCMESMAAGDRRGLKEIYEEYLSYVYSIIRGVVKNREDAQDLSADFFVKLYTGAGSWHPGGGHRAYLGKMARNLAIDHLRKSSRQIGIDDLIPEGNPNSPDVFQQAAEGGSRSAEDEALARMSFKEAVNSLPEQARTIVTMKVLGEMTFREIAQTLQIPMGTVTWRYQDSMKRLRRAVG